MSITKYFLSFEGDPLHHVLASLGPWERIDDSWIDPKEGDRKDKKPREKTKVPGAMSELADLMGWKEIHLSAIYMVDATTAAFSAYETSEERSAAKEPNPKAPRILQRNVPEE